MKQEQIGDAILYFADCRDVLRELPSVNSVITDPLWPTCPEAHASKTEHGILLHSALELITARTVVIILGFNCDPRWLTCVHDRWNYQRNMQLPYAFPGYRGRLLGGDEVAYCFGEIPSGTGTIPGRCPVESLPKSSRQTGHPFPRSDLHMKWLTHWWCTPGGVVLDPFMGTGATAIGCIRSGRRFIGIESNEQYFDIACQRVHDEYRQLRLFA